MTNFDSVDYFTDQSLVLDPHPYFDYLRSRNPMGCPITYPGIGLTLRYSIKSHRWPRSNS